ncbi:PTS system, mannose-specific IIA component [Clostridium cavendishii DSM 21758]|uniref:PTS system, mannose-specific IIA component n=1 Tax=Clostridium cavendishii DSM 21758 TaxID=1121302 RepID=A0A1M6SM95_9CLOT|nr:PTS sugar transporter subunit IIA [Clostridium cavendishii]SHK45871.1 PTS system, mannose-specific IIA component [Clostridium cavendishii DSM 21758]
MYKIMIVTHGNMAASLKETLKMFTNDLEGIHTVGLNESGVENFRERLKKEVEICYEEGKGLLVLADLFGGTPFNTCVLEIKNKYENVEIITGVNLPILIESSLQRDSNLKDIVKDLQQSAKESIVLTECLGSSEDED